MKLGKVCCKNQSGSTLILVIVAVAFVGIMATLLLSLTTMNYQMKNIDQTAKANFYSAEIAMDEIKMGLQDEIATQMEKAYGKLLVNYTDDDKNDETKKQKFLRDTFMNNMVGSLGGDVASETNTTYLVSKLKKYLSKDVIVTSTGNAILQRKEDPVTQEKYLLLKNVEVKFVEDNGYSTNIKTDIRISTPSMKSAGETLVYPNFGDFVFIADNTVEVLGGVGDFTADGSIYAGGNSNDSILDPQGLVVRKGGSLKVKGNHKVITKTDIVVDNDATLEIGEAGEEGEAANVWANNIRTRRDSAGSDLAAKLKIFGNTYTKDDLVLDARNSQVTLSGKYHGFNFGTTPYVELGKPASADSGESSAIMINGMSSTLDLSAINDLVIGGKAFITTKDDINHQNRKDIAIGESLTVKHNQIAYLMPSKYMQIGHNPMTEAEQQQLIANGEPVLKELPKSLKDYLHESEPTVTITPSTTYEGMKLTYYYLNFRSQKKATEYFQEYYGLHGNQIDEYLKMYAPDTGIGIGLPKSITGQFSIAGNLLGYNGDKSSLVGPTIDVDDLEEYLLKQEENTAKNYTDLTQTLMDYATITPSEEDKNSIFRTLVKTDKEIPVGGIKKVIIQNDENTNTDDYVAYFIDGSYEINSEIKGLVVATGDVKVNANFTGTIIAGGKILVGQSTRNEVKSDSKMIKKILEAEDDTVKEYLKTYISAMSKDGNMQMIIDFSKQLTYENWTKY